MPFRVGLHKSHLSCALSWQAECHSVLVDRMTENLWKCSALVEKKQQQHNNLARVEKTPCWIFISNRSDHTRASLWNAAEALKSLRAATHPDHISPLVFLQFLNFFCLLAGCFAAACDCWKKKKIAAPEKPDKEQSKIPIWKWICRLRTIA